VNVYAKRLQDAIAAVPGVTSAGAISHVPFDELPNWGGGVVPETAIDRTAGPTADYRAVTPGTLETFGVGLLEGRTFTEADQDAKNPAVIVDGHLAGRLWPGRSAIGQHLLVDPSSNGTPSQKATVIGVVAPLRLRNLVGEPAEQVFFSHRL